MEQTLNIGWQCNPMFNQGKDLIVNVERAIVVTGLQIDVSMLPIGPGISNILATVSFMPSNLPCGPGPQCYPITFGNIDFGPTQAWGGLASNGGIGGGGILVAVILKSRNGDESSRTVCRSGMQVAVPSGGILICHMDHAGSIAADGEMQGVLNYCYPL